MTERVTVVGPYPPMPGPEARAMFDLVRGLIGRGAEVLVVSPVPSAAHRHTDPGGARGAVRLVKWTRGADRVIVRLDATAMRAGNESPLLLAGQFVLGWALRRAKAADVILDRVPRGVSRRWTDAVLTGAKSIEVATSAERASLVEAGVREDRIAVSAVQSETADAAPVTRQPKGLQSSPPTALELKRIIRDRAAGSAVDRRSVGRASLPLRHLHPLERAPSRSRKPGVGLVKRLQARLLGWQFDWVIEHVNKLHQASIDAVELLEASHAEADRRPVERGRRA